MKRLLISALFLSGLAQAKTVYFHVKKSMYSPRVVNVHERTIGGEQAITVNFAISQMEINRLEEVSFGKKIIADRSYQKLEVDYLENTSKIGQPNLPYYSLLVRGTPNDIKIDYFLGRERIIENTVPAPSPIRPSREAKEYYERYVADRSYEYDQRSPVNVQYLGTFRGLPVSKVEFFPVRYLGTRESLAVHPEAEFRVFTEGGARVIKNDDFLKRRSNRNLLLITPEQFTRTLDPYVAWKEKQGYSIEVATTERIGNTLPAIKDFIKSRYDSHGLSYVIFVGNRKFIPSDTKPTAFEQFTKTDISYFLMDGPGDRIPDLYYGRFMAETNEDVAYQIQKIMEYEYPDYSKNNLFSRALGIASNEGSNPSDLEYVNEIAKNLKQSMNFEILHQDDPRSNPQTITDYLSGGTNYVTYVGHGSGKAWVSIYRHREYNTRHIPLMAPHPVKPVIVDVACKNGELEVGSFGERFLNEFGSEYPIGAAAYYGGSVNISWVPPAKMAVGISKRIYDETITTLGEALWSGQVYLYRNHSDKQQVYENMIWYHLFGDPTLHLRLGALRLMEVDKSSSQVKISYRGHGISKATVTFEKYDGQMSTVVTDRSGIARVPAGAKSVNIWAKGYYPYLKEL